MNSYEAKQVAHKSVDRELAEHVHAEAAGIEEPEFIQARDDVFIETDLYTYWEDGVIRFEFDGMPNVIIRELLKRSGFKWSPRSGSWVRKRTANGIAAGTYVCKELDRMAMEGKV